MSNTIITGVDLLKYVEAFGYTWVDDKYVKMLYDYRLDLTKYDVVWVKDIIERLKNENLFFVTTSGRKLSYRYTGVRNNYPCLTLCERTDAPVFQASAPKTESEGDLLMQFFAAKPGTWKGVITHE